jgi:recombination protein RecT
MSNEVAKTPTLGNFLSLPNTAKFLDDNLREKRSEFVSNLLALCDGDEKLAACEPKKLMLCAMNATALNLPLNKNLGFAYIIPYKGVPSFQIGYKGLIQLAIRSGSYEFLNACEIREGEITRNKITGEITFLGEKPDNKVVGYVAYLKLNTGFSASLYMTEAEIESHAIRFSKMYQYDKKSNTQTSKWSDSLARPKMAIKTVLKGLLGTYGLMTTDIKMAFEKDDEQETGDSFRDVQEAEIIPQPEPKEEIKKVKI